MKHYRLDVQVETLDNGAVKITSSVMHCEFVVSPRYYGTTLEAMDLPNEAWGVLRDHFLKMMGE